jgi:hypothetical protein
MFRPILAAGILALALATEHASAQQSQPPEGKPPAAQQPPAGQAETAVIGLPVYSSDGQKLGEVTDVGTSDGKRAVRAEMGEFLGLGPSSVVIGADAFQQKADRIELSMTADEVRAALTRQRKNKQEQN